MRIVALGDFHSGHVVGLTHPDFDALPSENQGVRLQLYRERRSYWNFYAETCKALQPITVAIINGDCIDGKGEKSGGTELIAPDRNEQCEMAIAAIEELHAGAILMSYGTPYHTGVTEDFEDSIAKQVKALKVGGEDVFNANGVLINYRHAIGSSNIPHGRFTALARARLWNVLWAEHGEYPKADIILRSHVHYHDFCGESHWLAMTLPALQGYGSKFGSRIAQGIVNFGLVHFDIENKDEWTWDSHILYKPGIATQVIELPCKQKSVVSQKRKH